MSRAGDSKTAAMLRKVATFLGCVLVAIAQVASAQAPVPLQAVINGPADIAERRTVVLDASLSRVSGQNVAYQWFVNDLRQPISRSVEAVYTPEKPGQLTFRLVVSALVEGKRVASEVTHNVTVYRRKIVLFADSSVPDEKISAHQEAATQEGVFLRVMQQAEGDFRTEQSYAALLQQGSAVIAGADAVVLWSEGVTALQSFASAVQQSPELLASITGQSIIVLTSWNLGTIARAARGPFSVLQPREIFITRKEALASLIDAATLDDFRQVLEQRDIDVRHITTPAAGVRPWNLLSVLTTAMLFHGVPGETIILLLMLPVIATILAFLKQVVGMTTFGLYTPSIVALSFLALGWKLGVLFLLFIIAVGYGAREVMRRWRLLYIPKVAVIITIVSMALLLLTGISALYDIRFSRDTIFVLLIMSTLAESFLQLKTEEGWRSALLGIAETIVASLICVVIVSWPPLQSVVLAYPELVFLTLVINVALGRFTGLRLVEYFRFREVFRHLQEE
jgi:hypothetical protein